jgi:polyisoprenoid-binding protein YceI
VRKQILLSGVALAVVVAGIISYNLFQTPEAASSPIVTPAPAEAVSQDVSVADDQLDSSDTASSAVEAPAVVEAVSEEASVANGLVYTIDTANSQARFIIDEILRNQDATVVGTTNQISGAVTFDSSDVQTAEISEILINARTIATDSNLRNRAIGNQILQTGQYEYISFVPTRLIGLPDSVQAGQTYDFQIVGDLTIIGQTREVTFNTQATLLSDTEMSGLAATTLKYEDFGITIPFSQAVQAVADEVTLELEFTAKAG